mmetsp:Transcript_41228/g.102550  ORF Transcript_41228/g.102550 Transcript_41228/m.102550 type:complete len:222 (-) Transcript_41228:58-723(-)
MLEITLRIQQGCHAGTFLRRVACPQVSGNYVGTCYAYMLLGHDHHSLVVALPQTREEWLFEGIETFPFGKEDGRPLRKGHNSRYLFPRNVHHAAHIGRQSLRRATQLYGLSAYGAALFGCRSSGCTLLRSRTHALAARRCCHVLYRRDALEQLLQWGVSFREPSQAQLAHRPMQVEGGRVALSLRAALRKRLANPLRHSRLLEEQLLLREDKLAWVRIPRG